MLKFTPKFTPKGNVHKVRPTILGNFRHTYLPMSDFIQFLDTYLCKDVQF